MSLSAKAEQLLALHVPGDPVVVPTVWDAWSARLAVDAGFEALTIGSHPVAESLGRSDHEGMSLSEILAQVAVITAAVDVPCSADLESGYGKPADQVIQGLLDAGAVGLNLEDTVHSEGGRLRTRSEHAEYIGVAREAADQAGVHVVINARTDILLREIGASEDRTDRAIAQLSAAAVAGADVLYPVGVHDDATQRRLTTELTLPVNAIGRPGIDSLARLTGLGVARISFGPYLQRALASAAGEIMASWVPQHA